MPVEVGDVFFFCLAFDQLKDAEEKMAVMALQKQQELRERMRY